MSVCGRNSLLVCVCYRELGTEDTVVGYLGGLGYSHTAKSPLTVCEEFWGDRWCSHRQGCQISH